MSTSDTNTNEKSDAMKTVGVIRALIRGRYGDGQSSVYPADENGFVTILNGYLDQLETQLKAFNKTETQTGQNRLGSKEPSWMNNTLAGRIMGSKIGQSEVGK